MFAPYTYNAEGNMAMAMPGLTGPIPWARCEPQSHHPSLQGGLGAVSHVLAPIQGGSGGTQGDSPWSPMGWCQLEVTLPIQGVNARRVNRAYLVTQHTVTHTQTHTLTYTLTYTYTHTHTHTHTHGVLCGSVGKVGLLLLAAIPSQSAIARHTTINKGRPLQRSWMLLPY